MPQWRALPLSGRGNVIVGVLVRLIFVAAIAALALCAACGPVSQENAANASCADDGARLSGTQLCQRTAADLIQQAEGAREITYPDGCSTVVNETMMIGDEALIYGAARCGDATTTLSFSAGAHSAVFAYDTAAVGGDALRGQEVIRVFGVDPDPQGALRAAIAELPAAQRANCEIRPANVEGWPADALVIAPTAAARSRMPADEPVAACGPMGFDEDSQSYWRIRQGQAWFYQLGQDHPSFDPASVTLIEKGPAGTWRARD